MVKDNTDFYEVKKPWSEIKDALLACYLPEYFAKVLGAGKPILYVDGFAGPGRFGDGSPGSPLIAWDAATHAILARKGSHKGVTFKFVEVQHSRADTLHRTLAAHSDAVVSWDVLADNFTSSMTTLRSQIASSKTFVYIDPFGIRDLSFALFTDLGRHYMGDAELLINMNSFGFFRAACQAMKVSYAGDEALDEDDPEIDDDMRGSTDPYSMLNSVAGGDYWQTIVNDYHRKLINGYEAERRFSEKYRQALGKSFRFVTSMPLRLKEKNRPKYRMIHAANHEDGCVLMADNMMNRSQDLFIDFQRLGQSSLFGADQGVEGDVVMPQQLLDPLRQVIGSLTGEVPAHEVMARFYAANGVICKTGKLNDALKQLWENREFNARWEPPLTKTGKPHQTFKPSSSLKVWIRHR